MSSFASRTEFVPLQLEQGVESQYLLGSEMLVDDVTEDSPAKKLTYRQGIVIGTSNLVASILCIALLYTCLHQSGDSPYATRDSVLTAGLVVAGIGMGNCILGVLGSWYILNGDNKSARSVLSLNHFIALVNVTLLIALSVSVLVHWDAQGNPTNSVLRSAHSQQIAQRDVIWGLALAASTVMIVILHGIMQISWPHEDDIYRWTVWYCCLFIGFTGGTVVVAAGMVWYRGELGTASNPWSVFGSVMAGMAYAAVGLQGFSIHSHTRVSIFLTWLPIVSVTLLFFSLANVISSEPDKNQDRKMHLFLSGIVGLFAQLLTVVAALGATGWRDNLKFS